MAESPFKGLSIKGHPVSKEEFMRIMLNVARTVRQKMPIKPKEILWTKDIM